MDILNEYLEEYKLPAVVRQSLRAYFHHCRYVWWTLSRAVMACIEY